MCAEHRIRDTFDRLASEYDELKLRVIPGYRQVQDLALRYANANSSERVLELGCGTAEWASAFLRSHPTANYVAVEFSPKMRDLASRRLASHRTRIQLLDQDLNASLPGGPFDLVVSFFAIHHVENKQRLIEEVFASLSSGGLFLYADITVAADPSLERAFQEGWRAFMLGAGLDPERIPYVLADHRDNDLAESSSTQLSYLRAAGFTPAEIIWCWEKFAVFYGAKPIPGVPAEQHATSGVLAGNADRLVDNG
jgi:tRNA (cmo5U34)-methyltransferase